MLALRNNLTSNTYNIQKPKYSNPSFRSNYQIMYDTIEKCNKTPYATTFFRNDLDWSQFVKLIFRVFRDAEKANIVCVGCSDGTEPASLLLKMCQKREYKNNPDKYTIKAYDINQGLIDSAKTGKFKLINNFNNIVDVVNIFFNVIKGYNKDYFIKDSYLMLAEHLKPKITYEKKDIIDVVSELPKDEKVVLMTRNIFPYLISFPCISEEHISKLFSELSKLKEGSILVIGQYDKDKFPDIETSFFSLGYKECGVRNCYKKVGQSRQTILNYIRSFFIKNCFIVK